jgi:50S ribosomal protein L16 3-hydroxylase
MAVARVSSLADECGAPNRRVAAKIKGSKFELAQEWWVRFVQDYWEKRPVALKRPFRSLIAAPDDLFHGIVEAARHFRADDPHNIVRFFIEHALLQANVRDYLPRLADRNIEGYHDRVSQNLRKRACGLVVVRYSGFDAATWLSLREFMRPLYEVIGIPENPVQIGVFLGDYGKTPFGIHKDPHGTFVFVIKGRKRFRTWPNKIFRREQHGIRSLDYEGFLNSAATVEGEPGDVLYWPSTYWHVGEHIGGLAASVSIAIFPPSSIAATNLWTQALHTIEDRLASDRAGKRVFYPAKLEAHLKRIPSRIDAGLKALMRAAHESTFIDALRLDRMNHLSALGFDSVPPPLPKPKLANRNVVRGNPLFPILSLGMPTKEIICSANGHSFLVPAHPNIPRLLRHLNSGKAYRVENLMFDYSGTLTVDGTEFEARPEDVRAILEKLYSMRALTKCRG